jgi:cell division protease FtsH
MSEQEKRVTAYHEGGHTVVAHFMEHHDPPHKVTIVSRGMAGGYTRFLPDEESHYKTGSMFRDQLCTALGGHAAEELIFGEASTGPSNDIEQVTRIARAMVTRWGMSERLGPRTFGKTEEMVFLGREISETRNYSEKVAEEIDDEVRRLIEDAQERARNVLREHRALLDKLAAALLEVETLEGDRLTRLLNSDPNEPWHDEEAPRTETPTPKPTEEAPRRPSFEPKPAPGLAWEGGSQSRIDGGS